MTKKWNGTAGESDGPGVALAVIRDGEAILTSCTGLANIEACVPITPQTNFRLASVSKQFTAMAIMLLADRRQLSLDARLPDLFPEFPACGASITVRRLLHHTSGLLDYEDLIPPGTTLPLLDRD